MYGEASPRTYTSCFWRAIGSPCYDQRNEMNPAPNKVVNDERHHAAPLPDLITRGGRLID